jgi:hypothetical protein
MDAIKIHGMKQCDGCGVYFPNEDINEYGLCSGCEEDYAEETDRNAEAIQSRKSGEVV